MAEYIKREDDSLVYDLISRQAAIDVMWKALYAYEGLTEKQFMDHEELELEDWFQHRIFVQRMHEECMKSIESLPPVEPTRPKGEWIGYNVDKEDWLRADGTPIFLVCDKCHGTVINNGSAHWNFCPNCGAKMD